LPRHAVIVGGTSLLEEFFQIVAVQAEGELAICTPFIDEAFTCASSAWAEMRHAQIDLRIVTGRHRNASNAWSAIRLFPWRSAEIWQCRNLHAKIYSFLSRRCGVALIGSHNLTRQGLAVNIEAGVLFKALTQDSELAGAVIACQEHINRLVQDSNIFVDTKHWPRPEELDGQEDNHE
jgi:HKD family nuclease